MTLGSLGGGGLSWVVGWGLLGLFIFFFFQILAKIVALVKLSKPHRLTQEIYDKPANGEQRVVSTARGRA